MTGTAQPASQPATNLYASKIGRAMLMGGASLMAIGGFSGAAFAQAAATQGQGAEATNAQPSAIASGTAQAGPQVPGDEIVVTGIRASLERSIAIKRDSTGVVDAISAEDIGKFPDTNLAESLQRITGVSIDRRNGEGSQVTVRGFGPQYNLVTLNGRQLATSDVPTVGGDESADFSAGTSRSFDFANLASEGVKTLEVYKTGRAAIPTGGIGATINVVSRRPLDARESGLNGSLGVKANYDTSVDACIKCGSHVTPEVTGLASWSDSEQRFGASIFGSYQKRNFSNINATSNEWNITTLSQFLDSSSGNVNAATRVTNAPSSGSALVARPNDFRYHFSEGSRERINGQAALQFRPTENLTLTADALFAQNKLSERRSDQSNWFNRPFDQVTFDTGRSVATAAYLHEVIAGATKDAGFEQQYRAQKNRLNDFGGNIKWDATDTLHFTVDGHIGKSESLPDNPNGASSTLIAISAPLLAQHSVDYNGGFPVQTVQFLDPVGGKGNGNGVLDVGDLGSQVGRTSTQTQTQRIKEGRIDGGWDLGGGSRFDFGTDYRQTKTHQTTSNTYQTLGDWGNAVPRDVNQIAPGLVQQICLVCKFTHYDPKASGQGLIAFRTENAAALYSALSNYYQALPGTQNDVSINGFADNRVKESIWAGYGQVTWKGELGGHEASLVAGARYERTTVRSSSLQGVPTAIIWQSDNDFTTRLSAAYQPQSARGKYNNLLPSMDFQINLKDNLIGRMSFSRTIARAPYGQLFASTSAGTPNDATAVGGVATGSQNDAGLLPLTSNNFDLSLEYYIKPGSYVSAGVFEKRVQNFITTTIVNKNLFGLRDPSSGVAGSRSGTAKAQLQALGADITDVNLFTYTALLQQNGGSTAAATTTFLANYNTTQRALNQAFVDTTLAAVDILADPNDPLLNFAVSTPINGKDAKIYGFELAGQYFLGNTGIGVQASYTHVHGDLGFDVNADPTANQFALVGLSDTANATLIYDKHGISARISYNWREKFLSDINRGGSHNPVFTRNYGQVDVNVSYDITKRLAVSFEGINVLERGVKTFARSTNEIYLAAEGAARYLVGARYRF